MNCTKLGFAKGVRPWMPNWGLPHFVLFPVIGQFYFCINCTFWNFGVKDAPTCHHLIHFQWILTTFYNLDKDTSTSVMDEFKHQKFQFSNYRSLGRNYHLEQSKTNFFFLFQGPPGVGGGLLSSQKQTWSYYFRFWVEISSLYLIFWIFLLLLAMWINVALKIHFFKIIVSNSSFSFFFFGVSFLYVGFEMGLFFFFCLYLTSSLLFD